MTGLGWIASLILGGLAGWIASMIMKANTGLLLNIFLGIVGAILANFLLSLIGITAQGGWLAQGFVGLLGACLLIAIIRAVRR
ncbi:GlsB/YeaQ/YmgE family stress response membrane protein [Litorisediminicola beolgyonensis]|uniref:GlsB/YeaQ/YmgE family stress response membrane protein n=1 Tax=Litorisediminicola beolgyonensis TaxID=1173614 RepID=A0ABW3ZI35_9RHOB